jgi:hypothetical protein
MKIILNQTGGLGNQLFQYAAALYFAKKYDGSLEIVREPEYRRMSHGHPRPFLLSHYRISTPVRDRVVLDRLLRPKSWLTGWAKLGSDLLTGPAQWAFGAHSHPYVSEEGSWTFEPSLPVPRRTRLLYLNGYFQAHQYAQSVEERLRREIVLRDAAVGRNLAVLHQIRSCEQPVSLHIRRGDYAAHWNGKNILTMAYYRDAIAAIEQVVPAPTYFVFSDDMGFARANLTTLPRVVFVDHNTEETAYEDLRLMSACRHHIMANSSFSWWGAWLNPNRDKQVIVANPWLDRTNPENDLVPPGWQCIRWIDACSQ